MKASQVLPALSLMFLTAVLMALVTAADSAPLPEVDGCFYGVCNDVAIYELWGTALNDRGYLYGIQDDTTLYLSVVVSTTVNDNLFGPDDYTGTGGWSASHKFDVLEQSDNVQLTLSCGSNSWTWGVDYIYDANEGIGDYDWRSGPEGPDGDDWCAEEHEITCGYPYTLTAASSLVWNLLNTTWPYSRTSPTEPSNWLSVDTVPTSTVQAEIGWYDTDSPWYWYDEAHPTRGWEWAMVYEMSLDVGQCGDDPIFVEVLSAHNSPSKDGEEDVPIAYYDYGDDPDSTVGAGYSFPTLLEHDGARHKLVASGPFMGAIVDKDLDGQPSPGAVGDDESDEDDDEDGLCCWSTLVPGSNAHVYVTMPNSPADCRLNAWIDFNGNGSWESQEQIFDGRQTELAAGQHNQLTFTVPRREVLMNTPLHTRWRCSTVADLEYWGEAPDGEVEDYVVTVTDQGQPMDLGDLPDEYGTLLSSDGPYHIIVPGFGLGGILDDEMDGHPSDDARGDDLCPPAGADDEDGVLLPNSLMPGKIYTIQVYLTNAAGYLNPVLNAWVDSDGNGFTEPEDHVLVNWSLSTGWNNDVPLEVPSAPEGQDFPIYLRFRLTGTPPLGLSLMNLEAETQVGPTLGADNGEVEDYVRYTPTGVLLDFFEAAPDGQSIRCKWRTVTNANLLGFYLYRAEAEAGVRTRLNDTLIRVRDWGSLLDASYEYLDETVEGGVPYFYWLHLIDLRGNATEYGPVRVTVPLIINSQVFLPLVTRP